MNILELAPCRRVAWQCVAGAPEWTGTRITFDLTETNGETVVMFAQRGWREQVEFMYHCSTKWATFLLSLKDLPKRGAGRPAPARRQDPRRSLTGSRRALPDGCLQFVRGDPTGSLIRLVMGASSPSTRDQGATRCSRSIEGGAAIRTAPRYARAANALTAGALSSSGRGTVSAPRRARVPRAPIRSAASLRAVPRGPAARPH